MINRLITQAEHNGITVAWHKGGPKAAWMPATNTISIREGMDDAQTLCAFAHEMGHFHHGDTHGTDTIQEARADRFAARLLIDPREYARCEQEYGAHPALLGRELGVTAHLVLVFQSLPINA
ncbi:hypothetical protein CPPEL_03070 [Corynebacterium pseudopelargi]|uniref:IrrE N-terminal-like domain-containing protein n=1 Tax=Corynebacterium pseudopelargi TaxID=2080757 RepID=A0A3G6ISW0_9CORY|nr:hypothetical protein CPPEL_03070 [Corynebacterium pseudopelargi]